MNLFKVEGSNLVGGEYPNIEFVIAISKHSAIKKYLENGDNDAKYIKCEYICERDAIIPTLEPIQEFNK